MNWLKCLVYAFALGALTAATGAQPIKLMPLGDSITTTDYRYHMHQGLVDSGLVSGIAFDFIGSQTGGSMPGVWDKDHEGHGGFTTDQLLNGRDAGGLKDYFDAGQFVAPDVVCLLTGTNDIGYDWGRMVRISNNGLVDPGESVPEYAVHETINDIRTLIGWLRDRNPNVKIALSTGIPSTEERRLYAPGTLEALKDEIVALVDGSYQVPVGLAPAPAYAIGNSGSNWGTPPVRVDPSQFVSVGISTAQSPVILVDHWTDFDAGTMLGGDQIHPTAVGQQFIGERFATAIEPWVVPEPMSAGLLLVGGMLLIRRHWRPKTE